MVARDSKPSTVIKLGGSLLGLPDLPARLADFLCDFARPRPVLIAGGGPAVELIRRWDRIYDLGEEASHWIALRTLGVTARIVERLLPDFTLVDSPEGFRDLWREGRIPVYDPYYFVAEIDESSLDPLPRRWRVTSDSIAARMASTFGAPELVLLKSVTFPERITFTEAARLGLVDPHFPVVARALERVSAVNLRAEEPTESLLYEAVEEGA